MTKKVTKTQDSLTENEQDTLKRLQDFAKISNLELFNVRGSLYQRVETITRNNGMCPCYRERRPVCPCPESIQECKDKGECGCRVFLAKK